MKKAASFLTAFLLTASLITPSFASDAVQAEKTFSPVYLNDRKVTLTGYSIAGNNYYMLRDLAYALRDTPACFDVVWNAEEKCVEMITGQNYSGSKEDVNEWGKTKDQAAPASSRLIVDGKSVNATAYSLQDHNYYKLRDLSEFLPLELQWVDAEQSIYLYPVASNAVFAESSGGIAREMSKAVSTGRWSQTSGSFLYEQDSNTFCVVDSNADSDTVRIDTYRKSDFRLLNSQSILKELEKFGGFYAGENNNYMVFGQENKEENDRKEVIRIVKYDKQFQRLDAVSVTGGDSFTIVPFHYGNLRMAESGSELTVHTGRTRYTTEDGLNHQSQLTIVINTDQMRVTNTMGQFQPNHVSHSFNQFVLYDDGKRVLLDHGDAYPRSIVMNIFNRNSVGEVELLKIPGTIGANCTGISLGGFESSPTHYLVAFNTIDHSKVTAYDSYQMEGLIQDEREIVVFACEKVSDRSLSLKQIILTDYIDHNMLGSTPYLVKISDDRFMVLWEEFEYISSGDVVSKGVCYVELDGSGKPRTELKRLENMKLSSDCQPIVVNGDALWYINCKTGRIFYRIPI